MYDSGTNSRRTALLDISLTIISAKKGVAVGTEMVAVLTGGHAIRQQTAQVTSAK